MQRISAELRKEMSTKRRAELLQACTPSLSAAAPIPPVVQLAASAPVTLLCAAPSCSPSAFCLLQAQRYAMAAQARAAADRAEANLDAMAARSLTQRAPTADEELHAAHAKGASAVGRAVAELWQMEARWRHLGLLKDLAATELMAELKDNPPLPGMSPLGTKGMMAAEVAKQQSTRYGKLFAYLPKATREVAARAAQQGRRMSMRNSRRLSLRGTGAMLPNAQPAESEEQMEKRNTLAQIPLLAGTSEETIESLLPLMDTIDIDTAGFELIKEGAVPSHFYILVEGDVEIVLKSGIRVAKLSGQHKNAASSYPFFGEIGMLMNAAAMAAARTSCACTLLGVSRANFPAFLALVPDLTQRMTVIGDLRAKQSKVLQHNLHVEDAGSSSSEEESDDGDDSTGNESDGYRMEETKELAALRPIYQSLDVDNSGAVDEWELWNFLRKAAKKNKSGGFDDVMSFEEMQRDMALIDKDGNGTIDWEEFTALMLGKVAGAEALAAAMRTAYAVGAKGDWDGTGGFRHNQRRGAVKKPSRRESVSMSLLPGSSERPIEDALLPVLRHVLTEQLPDDVAAVVRVIAPGGSRVQLNASAPRGNQARIGDHTL